MSLHEEIEKELNKVKEIEKIKELAEEYKVDEKIAAAKDEFSKVKQKAEESLKDTKASAVKDAAKEQFVSFKENPKEYLENAKANAMNMADNAKNAAAQTYGEFKDGIGKGSNTPDMNRDLFMLKGELAENGYDWWWHSFTAHNKETGEEKPFFIEFFTINPALGGAEPVLGQDEANRAEGKRPSYMMVKVGCWGKESKQLHRFFGWDSVNIKEDAPFLISADNCFLSETRTFGRVKVSEEEAKDPARMTDVGDMYWDLSIDKKIAFNVGYGASAPMRDLDAFEMFWHAQGIKTLFSGSIFLDGVEYEVTPETSFGYADKNWGCDFTSPWVWLSSCNMVSNITGERLENSAFDIGGGRPVLKNGLALDKKLLGVLNYEGTPYEFNFSKVWTLTKTQFKCVEGQNNLTWKVIQETPTHKMYTEVVCPKEEMLFVNYEAPDGSRKHTKLFNGGNGTGNIKIYKKSHLNPEEMELIDDIKIMNVGCEYGEYEED